MSLGLPEQHLTVLVLQVAWIVGDPAEWIAERSHGLLEGDLVLGAIGRRLPRIPLEPQGIR